MRMRWAILASAVVMVLAIACGGGESPTPAEQSSKSEASTATVVASEAPTATDLPSGALGTLEVRVTDQPGAEVTAIVLTVQNIEVSTSDGAESGWQRVLEGPFEFDLLQLDGIEEILGSAMLGVGRYQQIRLEVVSAQVTIPNGVRPAAVPSDKLRLVGGFEVVENETTIVTLDFDAQRSVVFVPRQGPQLKPVVKLLVRRGGQSLEDASEVSSASGDIPGDDDDDATATDRPGTSQERSSGTDGLTPVRVVLPTADNLQFMSFWIALGAGYFRDEGLDVEVIVPPNPMATGNLLLQLRADVAVMPPAMVLPLIAQEVPIVVFGNLLQNDALNIVVRKEVMAERNLDVNASLEERIRGLRGLRVGVAPGPPTRLRVMLESVGLNADEDIEMVILGGHEQNQAFEDGLVDALYAHSPFLETALVRQDAVLLVNVSAGEVSKLSGNRQIQLLVTTREFDSEEREVLVGIIRAVQNAQDLAHSDLAATAQAVLDSGVPDLETELLETIVEIYSRALPESPAVSAEGLTRELELFPAHLQVPDLSGVSVDDFVSTEIIEAARP